MWVDVDSSDGYSRNEALATYKVHQREATSATGSSTGLHNGGGVGA